MRTGWSHADLLADDALLLVHALLGEVGDGDKVQQNTEIVIEVLRGLKIVGSHGVAGEGVLHRAVFRQLLEGVALLRVEHLVLQVVGDPGGGVHPLPVQLKAQIHTAVAGGKKGVFLGVVGLLHHHHLQAVAELLSGDGLPQLGIFHHCAASFPFRK